MSAETLRFHCPACQAVLTVPASMAGVRGPCPICSAEIQAPLPAPPPPAEVPVPRPEPAPPVDPLAVAPSPRHLQAERDPRKISARPMEDFQQPTAAVPPHRKSLDSPSGGNGLIRIGIPLLLVIASGAVVFFIMKSRDEEPTARPPVPAVPPAAFEATAQPPAVRPAMPEAPAPAGETPPENEPVALTQVQEAKRVAVAFLKATSLEPRLDMIEPALTAEQLGGTLLAGPLPEMHAIKELPQTRDIVEQYIDFPFLVGFSGNAPVRRMLLMVRQRDQQPPRVLVEPVLDLLGGRLAEFAKAPTGDGMTYPFRAIIEPMPRSFEEGIPNPDDKFTYKLLSADGGTEIARAYASQHSKLAEQLYSISSPARWGKRVCATLLLSWNTTEDPNHPYIRVSDIKSYNWSP
ncbi:hypothetical protein [Haloferula sargassicola]|uniref:Uncharacterized protein n=1 Tax=Haloferula sargassicola TaxID=490096 RepID=A0ABP9US52_9BACT